MSAAVNPAPIPVLVIGNRQSGVRELADMLDRGGYLVTLVDHGRDVLQRIRAVRPAFVISDLNLEGMDGYTLTTAIRAEPDLASLPVVLSTPKPGLEDVIRALQCGADGILPHPIELRYLDGLIEWVLVNRNERQAHAASLPSDLVPVPARAPRDEGESIVVNGRTHVIKAERQQVLGMLLAAYEMSFQRQQSLLESQRALESKSQEVASTNRFLDSVIEHLPTGIFVVRASDMKIVQVNRAAERVVGVSRENLLGTSGTDLLPAGLRDGVDRRNRRLLENPEVFDVPNFPYRRADGQTIIAHVRTVPVVGADDRTTHLVVMCEDITERAQAETRLLALNAELTQKTEQLMVARLAADAASQAKSDFLASMSHELRTPLNGVIGMVDVLHQSRHLEHQVDLIDSIRYSAETLTSLIEDILDFSKIEAGKMTLEKAPVDMSDLVERTCEMVDSIAVDKGVELRVFVDPALPASMLADAVRIRQILLNLIGNAIKFSSGREDCPGLVSVRAERADPAGERGPGIHLSVRDNGIGIEPAAMSRLFDVFEQLEASTTRRFGGSGLGLAITSRLIGLMKGRLVVQSKPGEGATFSVFLPCELETVVTAETKPPVARLDGFDCLAIGADAGMADDLALYLQAAGAQVRRVADLSAAEQAAGSTGTTAGPAIWVYDSGSMPAVESLATALGRACGSAGAAVSGATRRPLLALQIERGRRRNARLLRDRVASIDGNVLTRRRFIDAVVALAEGRVKPHDVQDAADGEPSLAREAASRPVSVRVDTPVNAGASGRRSSLPHPPADVVEAAGGKAPVRRAELILVAEDNAINQRVISRQLALLGFASEVVADGERALACWQAEPTRYAMILTDLQMPNRDGWSLAGAVRAYEAEQGVAIGTPLVALSANVGREEKDRCREVGMDDHLSKPIATDRLAAMLERWLPLTDYDSSVLGRYVGDDPEIQAELLQDFRRAADRLGAGVLAALAGDDHATAARLAHQLVAACRTIGALPLAETCTCIEALAREGDSAALAGLRRLLQLRLARLAEQMPEPAAVA